MRQLNYEFNVGIAAISWVNDDIPGLGDETSIDEILKEMNELGYIATEKGRTFPDDEQELKALLNKHNMTLASQFVSVLFSDPALHDEQIANFRKQAEFLKAMGCDYVIVCEMAGSTHWDARNPERRTPKDLSEEEWDSLAKGLNKAGEIAREYGMQLVYHAHAGTVIEQKEDVDKLMKITDARYVNLLFDSGHALYGNYDPYEFLINHLDRIKYVHYKDVRPEVLKACRAAGKTFREEVVDGIFTVPGDGVIDFQPIMRKLMETNYHGWIIVEAEQDPAKANPYEYAKKAIEYLQQTEEELVQELTKGKGEFANG